MISAAELAAFTRDMQGQLPADARILSLVTQEPEKLEIYTGTRTGTLGGRGRVFRFEKKEAGWALTGTAFWVS